MEKKMMMMMIQQQQQEEPIFHPFHPHELFYHDDDDDEEERVKREWCRACCKDLDDGRPYFSCKSTRCGFRLHERCAKQPADLFHHPIHPHHLLVLHEEKPDGSDDEEHSCDACFRPCFDIHDYVYICTECDFHLHLSCAMATKYQQVNRIPKKVTFKHTADSKHDLILYHVSQIFDYDYGSYDPHQISKQVRCGWCRKNLKTGWAYACFRCLFFLHEDCTFKLPSKIRHPSNKLSSSSSYTLCLKDYGITTNSICLACKDWLDEDVFDFDRKYSCLIIYKLGERILHGNCFHLLLPSLKSEHHPRHGLTYFENANFKGEFSCHKCGKITRTDKFSRGGFYRCIECDMNFHVGCILLEDTPVTHKYHRHPLLLKDAIEEEEESFCDLCETERNPNHPLYYCKEECGHCVAHIECTHNQERSHLSTLLLKNPREFLMSLEIKSDSSTTPREEKILTEEEIRWQEIQAKFPPQLSNHPLHSHHTLILKFKARRQFICDVCGDCNSRDTTNYKCQECSFIIDTKCATSSSKAVFCQGQRFKKSRIRHFSHRRHPLHLMIFSNTYRQCYHCSYGISGLGYVCLEDYYYCQFYLHQSCLKQFPREISLPQQHHPLHPFKFMKGLLSTSHCIACGSSSERDLYYGCGECGDKFVHFICVPTLRRRPLLIYYESHQDYDDKYELYYFGNQLNEDIRDELNKQFDCKRCGERCTEAFYRCIERGENFHLDCVPIPRVIKTKFHRHPVKLVDSLEIQGYDDSDHYCDVCEEQRDPRHHAYSCDECSNYSFVAHIECILGSKAEEVRSQCTFDDQSTSSGEDSWETCSSDDLSKDFRKARLIKNEKRVNRKKGIKITKHLQIPALKLQY